MQNFQNLIFDERRQDAIEPHHRYHKIQFKDITWDLSHLNSFVINFDPGVGFDLAIVVLFSCHCFSRALSAQEARLGIVCRKSLYDDGRELRILDESRYQLSRKFLPIMLDQLIDRKIQVLPRGNFLTFETYSAIQGDEKYAVFFDVKKDAHKRRRLLLRVQSAYGLKKFNARQLKAKKVRFSTLIKSVFECRSIRP